MDDLRQMVEEIGEVIDKIGTQWECEFIDSMDSWGDDYTEKQEEIIRKLYKKACDSPY